VGELLPPLELELIIEVHRLALDVVGEHSEDSFNIFEGRVGCVDGFLEFGYFFFDVEVWLFFVGMALLLLLGFLLLLVLFVGPS